MTTLSEILNRSRTELLDLGLRNSLINFRTPRSKGVRIIDELAAQVFTIIVTNGRSMDFLPQAEEIEDPSLLADLSEEERRLFIQPDDEPSSDGIAARHKDSSLQTPHSPAELQKRLLNTFDDARSSIEEQGVNRLFLSLGTLSWHETNNPDRTIESPIILIPVELSRNDASSRFRVKWNGDDVGGNYALQTKLKQEYRIDLPQPDIEQDNFEVADYFEQVSKTIADKAGWSLAPNKIELGFFSFAKHQMYNDLDEELWPDTNKPTAHPILSALLSPDGFFSVENPGSGHAETVDDVLQPDKTHQILDADSSQVEAIRTALNSSALVIQGPPGTGKSQTITNIIAEAIGSGKKVLFVAEKMAALEVVKRRLDGHGLGDTVLELHSHKAKKTAVLAEIRRTYELTQPDLAKMQQPLDDLVSTRDTLNDYARTVNSPIGATSVTPYIAFGKMLQAEERLRGINLPSFSYNSIETKTEPQLSTLLAQVDEYFSVSQQVGELNLHPFRESQLQTITSSQINKLMDLLTDSLICLEQIQQISNRLSTICHELVINVKNWDDLNLLQQHLEQLVTIPFSPSPGFWSSGWESQHLLIAEVQRSIETANQDRSHWIYRVKPDAWLQDVSELRTVIESQSSKLLRAFSANLRNAKKHVEAFFLESAPAALSDQLEFLRTVELWQSRIAEVEKKLMPFKTQLPELWVNDQINLDTFTEFADWVLNTASIIGKGVLSYQAATEILDSPDSLSNVRDSVRELAATTITYKAKVSEVENSLQLKTTHVTSELSIDEQKRRFELWRNSLPQLQDIAKFNSLKRTLQGEGLGELLTYAISNQVSNTHVKEFIEKKWYTALIERVERTSPLIATFDASSHQASVLKFQELDRRLLKHSQLKLVDQHWKQIPQSNTGGQLQRLKLEFEKKRRHLPIRKLMEVAGNAIQAIKPVFMMSPMSITSYLPPGKIQFDLVIFDEASQVKPVDAYGAILRGKQVVVVGDTRQLPPTSFFDSNSESDDADAPDSADVESILGLFLGKGAQEVMLRWHYRSKHESLIALSNREFYDGRLVLFPSPTQAIGELGLVYHYLPDTHYEPGDSKRINVGEAKAVAAAAMEHARKYPSQSLGIAAFSQSQMQAIRDQLEILRRQDPSCELYFGKSHPNEPFFIKNLENVQGDERDVIFISIGYGRTIDGRVAMNFGPLNKEGGHRRLNVLITRAKLRCEIFTNLTADDIATERSSPQGLTALKRYLKYAKEGELDLPHVSQRESDSPFEDAVASALRAAGYEVHQQVGAAGFYVDMAVVDPDKPGRYLLGIECDGAQYHSAASARDRDRLRQSILESLGWRIHRVWSTAWFRNQRRELEKVSRVIEEEKQRILSQPLLPVLVPEAVSVIERLPEQGIQPEESVLSVRYVKAQLSRSDYDASKIDEIPENLLDQWIRETVQVESPVHVDDVKRRVADHLDIKRIGKHISKALEDSITRNIQGAQILKDGEFLLRFGQTEFPIRDRSNFTNAEKQISRIAPAEIAATVVKVVGNSISIDRQAVVEEVYTLLGFKRSSADITEHVEAVITGLVSSGVLRSPDGRILDISRT